MKVEGPRPGAPLGERRKAGAAEAGAAFSAPSAGGARSVSGVAPSASTPSLDALLALQGERIDPEARRRQARRGAALLDALEALRTGLLEGRAPAALRGDIFALSGQTAPTGEAALDDLLREIDTRAAVELAKLERR